MKDLINKVRQWGLDRGIVYTGEEGQDKVEMMEAQARYTLKETAELLDAYADRDAVALKDAIGDVLVTLIVGASSDEEIFNFVVLLMDAESYSSPHPEESGEIGDLLLGLVGDVLELEGARDRLGEHHYVFTVSSLVPIVSTLNQSILDGVSVKDCLEHAYNEIKDRTGKVVDGQFIKDE